MSVPLLTLVLFALWALLLVGGVGGWRAVEVLAGKKPANAFPSGQQHGSDTYWRLNRAHVNAVENLPIFGAVAIAAHLTQTPVDLACWLVVGGRVVQSLFHVASGRSIVVNLRFTAFLVQVLSIAYIGIMVVLS